MAVAVPTWGLVAQKMQVEMFMQQGTLLQQVGLSTTGAHQLSSGGGGNDAFLGKFSSTGVRQWGTFYGGASIDYGYACAVDATGKVYLTGRVGGGAATGVISTTGSHQVGWGGYRSFLRCILSAI